MVRRMLGWSSALIVVVGTIVLGAGQVRAEHDEHRELRAATDHLRLTMTQFAEIASRRQLSGSDYYAIRSARASARRLADSAHGGSWRSIVSAYSHLRAEMDALNRRLHRSYALRGDHRLWNSWAHVMDDFSTVRWYVEGSRGHNSHDHHGDHWDRHDGHGHGEHGHGDDHYDGRVSSGYDFGTSGYTISRGNSGLRIQVGSPYRSW